MYLVDRQSAARAVDGSTPRTEAGPRYVVPPTLLISAACQLVLMSLTLLTLAAWVGSILPLTWRFSIAAVGCFGLVAVLVFLGLPRHSPHRHFGPANLVTLTRGLLTALLLGVAAEQLSGNLSFLSPQTRWLVVLAATVALLSDGLDGWTARRSGMASDFGAHFDMEVDTLFLLVLSMLVYATGEIGAWVMASGVLRYAFVLSGYAWSRLSAPLLPAWRRKIICVLQFAVLIAALVPALPTAGSQLLCLGGLILLCYSFAVDVVSLSSRSPLRSRLP